MAPKDGTTIIIAASICVAHICELDIMLPFMRFVAARTVMAANGNTPEHSWHHSRKATSAGSKEANVFMSRVLPTRPVPALKPMEMRSKFAADHKRRYALKTRRPPSESSCSGIARAQRRREGNMSRVGVGRRNPSLFIRCDGSPHTHTERCALM